MLRTNRSTRSSRGRRGVLRKSRQDECVSFLLYPFIVMAIVSTHAETATPGVKAEVRMNTYIRILREKRVCKDGDFGGYGDLGDYGEFGGLEEQR